jgi:acyl-coenzyme A thioesterase PaaI-like protein
MTDYRSLINKIPYAQYHGIVCQEAVSGIQFILQADERFIGNPMIRAFHGGVINGLLGCSMRLTTMHAQNLEYPPELISITTTFLRSAKIENDLFSSAKINRTGRRVVSVSADVWQRRDGEELILVAQATASLKILENKSA